MTVAAIRRSAGLIGCALMLAISVVVAQAAPNALEMELQAIDSEIQLNEAILEEIERQGNERIAQLEAWHAFWDDVRALTTEKADTLEKDFKQILAEFERAEVTLQAVTADASSRRDLPHFSRHSVATLAKSKRRLIEAYEKTKKLIADGKKNWEIAAVGRLTGSAIDRKMDRLSDDIQRIAKAVRDGTWTIIYGRREINGRQALAAIAKLEKKRRSVIDQVSKGEYKVHIPGLGWHTRNSLDKEIARAERAIKDLTEKARRGELGIRRGAIGWKTRNQLERDLKKGAESFAAMEKLVGQGLYTVHIDARGAGWQTLQKVEKRLAEWDESLAKTQAAIQDGSYPAHTTVGWRTLKSLEEALESTRKRLNNPKLGDKERKAITEKIEKLRKAMTDWQTISAMDLVIRGLETTRITGWLALPLKLAKPDYERRRLVREEREAHMADFERELKHALAPLEAELARLEEARSWIPGGP